MASHVPVHACTYIHVHAYVCECVCVCAMMAYVSTPALSTMLMVACSNTESNEDEMLTLSGH